MKNDARKDNTASRKYYIIDCAWMYLYMFLNQYGTIKLMQCNITFWELVPVAEVSDSLMVKY